MGRAKEFRNKADKSEGDKVEYNQVLNEIDTWSDNGYYTLTLSYSISEGTRSRLIQDGFAVTYTTDSLHRSLVTISWADA